MAADEEMAVRFYKVGDAASLANELVHVLQSPELQQQMGWQNFAAGLEMTIGNVVRNYLRWFELNRFKRELAGQGVASMRRPLFVPARPMRQPAEGNSSRDAGASNAHPVDIIDPFA
jgi:hypothetical protein